MARTKTITATKRKAKSTKTLPIPTDAELAALPVGNWRSDSRALECFWGAMRGLADRRAGALASDFRKK
jgi:hypothetical protein